jgi:O-antigen/teichoic acid export membrane protein
LAVIASRPLELQQTFARSIWGLTAFGLALGAVVTLFASPIVELTFGSRFAAAVPILQVLMWSLLPALLRGGRTLYWYALGQEQFANMITAVSLVLQIGLSLWLIPLYGAVGAAWVGIVCEVAALVLLWRPMRLFPLSYAKR